MKESKPFGVKEWAIMIGVILGIMLLLSLVNDIRNWWRGGEEPKKLQYLEKPVPHIGAKEIVRLRVGGQLNITRPTHGSRFSPRFGYYGTNTVYMTRDGRPETEIPLPARDDPNYRPLRAGGRGGTPWKTAQLYTKSEPPVQLEYYFVE